MRLTHDYDDAEDERHQDCGEQAEEAARGEPILLVVVAIVRRGRVGRAVAGGGGGKEGEVCGGRHDGAGEH